MATSGRKQEAAEYRGEVLDTGAVLRAVAAGYREIYVREGTTVTLPAQTLARSKGIVITVIKAPDEPQPITPQQTAPAAFEPAAAATVRLSPLPIHPEPLPERKPENYPATAFRTPPDAPRAQPRITERYRAGDAEDGSGIFSRRTAPTAPPSTAGSTMPPSTEGGTTPLSTNGGAAPAGRLVEREPNGWATVTPATSPAEALRVPTVPLAEPVAPPAEGPAPAEAEAPLDPITIDLIENALRNIRYEMDAVLFRTAMSPGIREQHDEFPLIADPNGKMVAGQFGSFIAGFLQEYRGTIEEGDIFLLNDPYSCAGAISHLNDWLVLLPIYYEGQLVGWASMFGHLTDVGGAVPSSMPIDARTIHSEGVIIKPFKLYRRGVLDEERLQMILDQVRLPEWNRADLMGIVAACRMAERRIRELCARFGARTYLRVLDALLERNYRAVKELIRRTIPETPQSFEDYVCDDGQGFGPYKIKCTVWREGDKAIFDWTGTDPQSPAAINFYLNVEMLKMFVGVYLIMVHDPQILFNDGYYDLIEVRIPEGSLLKPRYPAALSGRTHALGRVFDVFGGALGKGAPEFMTAAGFSTSPHLMYSGYDQNGEWVQLYQIGFGGVPGRPIGDGLDGHSLWPEFTNVPNEYLETYYPVIIERYELVQDSGGAGKHRGGNGINQVYHWLAAGEVSIHDDRWLTYPWGVLGGKPAMRGRKILVKPDGQQIPLPSKADHIRVEPGDRLHFITWGGGGWGDPLERDPELVRLDVLRGLVSEVKARDEYGVVVLDEGLRVDYPATEALRAQLRATRGPLPAFDFGPPLPEILARCREETGLEPPAPPVFHQHVAGARPT
jgi:N-methylhydantoinase B